MKFFFVFLVGAATVAPAPIRTALSENPNFEKFVDVFARNIRPSGELAAKIDKLLNKIEPVVAQLAEQNHQKRMLIQTAALVAQDCGVSVEERNKLIESILDQAELTDKEKATFRMPAVECKDQSISGVVAHQFTTKFIKMICTDEFLEETPETRRNMIWRMGCEMILSYLTLLAVIFVLLLIFFILSLLFFIIPIIFACVFGICYCVVGLGKCAYKKSMMTKGATKLEDVDEDDSDSVEIFYITD